MKLSMRPSNLLAVPLFFRHNPYIYERYSHAPTTRVVTSTCRQLIQQELEVTVPHTDLEPVFFMTADMDMDDSVDHS